MIISFALLLVSAGLFRRSRMPHWHAGIFGIIGLAGLVLLVFYFIADYFSGDGINADAIYFLVSGLDGAGFADYHSLIIGTVTATSLGILLYVLLLLPKPGTGRVNHAICVVSYTFAAASLFVNPATADIYRALGQPAALIAESNQIGRYYRVPYIFEESPRHKNLLLIYAESLERTYFDETVFPGLIKGLRSLEEKATSFTDIVSVKGATNTMSGMFASQCGIPLFLPGANNTMHGMDTFAPGIVCLGDLLSTQGYLMSFFGGASLAFAGKGNFLRTHGFDRVYGRNELLSSLKDQTYLSGWGLYDDSLFELAFENFLESSRTEEKFGLVLLTLDTHSPNGAASRSCAGIKYQDGANPTLNAVACSDYLITKFVHRVLVSEYGRDVVVAILSDHIALKNSAKAKLSNLRRRNLFLVIDGENQQRRTVDELGSSLDIGPSLLPFLGYTAQIGLGSNLLKGDSDRPRVVREHIQASTKKWQRSTYKYLNFPSALHGITIDPARRMVQIDNRDFIVPLLIEIDDEFNTVLQFTKKVQSRRKPLFDYIDELPPTRPFLLIDNCERIPWPPTSRENDRLCVLAGVGDQFDQNTRLKNDLWIGPDYIRHLAKTATPTPQTRNEK